MMQTIEQVFQTIQRSTASGKGTSYWEIAGNCGEKRYLTDLNKTLAEESLNNETQKQRGTYVHALLDFWHKGQLPEGLVIDVGSIQDPSWAEAVKIFNFYKEHFSKDYWGKTIASELKMPCNEAHLDNITKYFGHSEVTGTIDSLRLVSEADIARIYASFGILLPRPGLYILDWKTAAARASDAKARGSYTESIQSKLYPLLWNLIGGEQCQGIIYVVFVAHQEMRRHDENPKKLSSIQVFYANHSVIRDHQAKAAINFARTQRDLRVKNNYACIDYTGNECIFRSKGICDGL